MVVARPVGRPRAQRAARPGRHGVRGSGRAPGDQRAVRDDRPARRVRVGRSVAHPRHGAGLVARTADLRRRGPPRGGRSGPARRPRGDAVGARRCVVRPRRDRPFRLPGRTAVAAGALRLPQRHRPDGHHQPAPTPVRLQRRGRQRGPDGARLRGGARRRSDGRVGARHRRGIAGDHPAPTAVGADGARHPRCDRGRHARRRRLRSAGRGHRADRRAAAGSAVVRGARRAAERSRGAARPCPRDRDRRLRRHERAVADVRAAAGRAGRSQSRAAGTRRGQHRRRALPRLPGLQQPVPHAGGGVGRCSYTGDRTRGCGCRDRTDRLRPRAVPRPATLGTRRRRDRSIAAARRDPRRGPVGERRGAASSSSRWPRSPACSCWA